MPDVRFGVQNADVVGVEPAEGTVYPIGFKQRARQSLYHWIPAEIDLDRGDPMWGQVACALGNQVVGDVQVKDVVGPTEETRKVRSLAAWSL